MSQGTDKLNRLSAGIAGIAVRLLLFTCFLLAVVRGASAAYRFGYDAFYEGNAAEAPGTEVFVTIPEGADVQDVARLLKQKGLVDNVWAVRLQAAFLGLGVKPGSYVLNSSETVEELLEQLNAGVENDRTETEKAK